MENWKGIEIKKDRHGILCRSLVLLGILLTLTLCPDIPATCAFPVCFGRVCIDLHIPFIFLTPEG